MKKEGHQNTRVQVGAQNKKMYPAVTNIKKQVSDKPFKKTQLVPEVPGIEKKTKKKKPAGTRSPWYSEKNSCSVIMFVFL